MLLEQRCTGTITSGWHQLGLESVFWSFLIKTKQDQALPSHIHGKIWPHSIQFWLWFCSSSAFLLRHPLRYHYCVSYTSSRWWSSTTRSTCSPRSSLRRRTAALNLSKPGKFSTYQGHVRSKFSTYKSKASPGQFSTYKSHISYQLWYDGHVSHRKWQQLTTSTLTGQICARTFEWRRILFESTVGNAWVKGLGSLTIRSKAKCKSQVQNAICKIGMQKCLLQFASQKD